MNKIVKMFFAASLVAMCFSCSQSEQKTSESTTPSFDEVLKTRRSVRSYDASKTITKEQVKELLTSTQEAPSWANQQPNFKFFFANHLTF